MDFDGFSVLGQIKLWCKFFGFFEFEMVERYKGLGRT